MAKPRVVEVFRGFGFPTCDLRVMLDGARHRLGALSLQGDPLPAVSELTERSVNV
jgi:hypothetical protein